MHCSFQGLLRAIDKNGHQKDSPLVDIICILSFYKKFPIEIIIVSQRRVKLFQLKK